MFLPCACFYEIYLTDNKIKLAEVHRNRTQRQYLLFPLQSVLDIYSTLSLSCQAFCDIDLINVCAGSIPAPGTINRGFQTVINDVISKIIMYEADALRGDDIVPETKTSLQVFWVNTMN